MGVQQEVQNRTIRVSLYVGSFETEVTGETEAELEQKLRRGISSVLALHSLVPKLEANYEFSPKELLGVKEFVHSQWTQSGLARAKSLSTGSGSIRKADSDAPRHAKSAEIEKNE